MAGGWKIDANTLNRDVERVKEAVPRCLDWGLPLQTRGGGIQTLGKMGRKWNITRTVSKGRDNIAVNSSTTCQMTEFGKS